jgi:hypothetical protein
MRISDNIRSKMSTKTSRAEDDSFASKLIDLFSRTDSGNDSLFYNQDYSWVLEWVSDHFSPDQVFSQSDLREWAEDNGWLSPEKQ